MQQNLAITIEDVSMQFYLASQKTTTLKEYFIYKAKQQFSKEEFWALQDINLEVKKGESMAFVGLNGSGKSTLLKIIAGVYKPTTGKVTTHGVVAPMINLGAGFDMELTARENIYLNAAILGYSKEYVHERFDDIVEFAELEKFIDVPVKNFSSGMVARLGFSVATSVEPDILIVDEVLSVGDYLFRQKCERRIEEILNRGATLLLVSHSTEQVKGLCKSAILLEDGKITKKGNANEVCDYYEQVKDD